MNNQIGYSFFITYDWNQSIYRIDINMINLEKLHEEEAYAAWNKAVRGEHFDKIKPL